MAWWICLEQALVNLFCLKAEGQVKSTWRSGPLWPECTRVTGALGSGRGLDHLDMQRLMKTLYYSSPLVLSVQEIITLSKHCTPYKWLYGNCCNKSYLVWGLFNVHFT